MTSWVPKEALLDLLFLSSAASVFLYPFFSGLIVYPICFWSVQKSFEKGKLHSKEVFICIERRNVSKRTDSGFFDEKADILQVCAAWSKEVWTHVQVLLCNDLLSKFLKTCIWIKSSFRNSGCIKLSIVRIFFKTTWNHLKVTLLTSLVPSLASSHTSLASSLSLCASFLTSPTSLISDPVFQTFDQSISVYKFVYFICKTRFYSLLQTIFIVSS